MSAFAQVLGGLLQERNLSGRVFAGLVGMSQSYVAKILRGNRPPPLGALSRWMETLQLPATERKHLQLLAELEHLPPLAARVVTALVLRTSSASRRRPARCTSMAANPGDPPGDGWRTLARWAEDEGLLA
jgi:transcriptional regulator with XRE-family HTH domain